MTKKEIINLLKEDLKREYAHWHFYMAAAMQVTGLHREEYQEFFMKEAAGEMAHIKEFGDLIIGLGGELSHDVADFQSKVIGRRNPIELLAHAMCMETEVVSQFVTRMEQADELEKKDKIDGRYIQIFLEDQMMDSRKTVDHLNQILVDLRMDG